MIKTPTCLVLGAGASSHLGFPLGIGLRDEIISNISLEISALMRRGRKLMTPEDHRLCDDFETLSRRLGCGAWLSPDAFLERYPEHVELGKLLIAKALQAKEDASKLFPPAKIGWYEHLRQSLASGTRSAASFKNNKLSIITFNYERSIDCFLHRFVAEHYKLDEQKAWHLLCSAMPIVHLHGSVGQYPDIEYSSFPFTRVRGRVLADQIKIISEFGEIGEQFCSSEFETANLLLQKASRIIFLGFGFADANVNRLKFLGSREAEEKSISAVVGRLTGRPREKLKEKLGRLGVADLHWMTCNKFFECHASLED